MKDFRTVSFVLMDDPSQTIQSYSESSEKKPQNNMSIAVDESTLTRTCSRSHGFEIYAVENNTNLETFLCMEQVGIENRPVCIGQRYGLKRGTCSKKAHSFCFHMNVIRSL